MNRFLEIYRLFRAALVAWSWPLPDGVTCYVAPGPGAVRVLLGSDEAMIYTDLPPGASAGLIRTRLDAMHGALLSPPDDDDDDDPGPGPGAWSSPTLSQAGLHFSAAMERARRADEEHRDAIRRLRDAIPTDETKGGIS